MTQETQSTNDYRARAHELRARKTREWFADVFTKVRRSKNLHPR